jgi:hypothetical protein
MNERQRLISEMRDKRMTYREIGGLLGISWQRVHQIHTGYAYRPLLIPPEKHKIWTEDKRKLLKIKGSPAQNGITSGGRDWVRELVRIRDKHRCQMCFKQWRKGMRRFDVHHTNESQEGTSFKKHAAKRDKKNIDKMTTLCHKCHLNLDSVRKKMSVAQKLYLDKKS